MSERRVLSRFVDRHLIISIVVPSFDREVIEVCQVLWMRLLWRVNMEFGGSA